MGLVFLSGFLFSGGQTDSAKNAAGAWTTENRATAKDFVGSFTGSGVWSRKSSDGTWKLITPDAAYQVACGDFNADGKDDILGVWTAGIWVKNTGGSWTNLVAYDATFLWADLGDLDGDGKADFVGSWTSGLYVRYTSTGTWQKIVSTPPTQLSCGDFDGNGKDDILGVWDTGIWIYKDSGAWEYVVAKDSNFVCLTAGDMDGDGRSDLVTSWNFGIWVKYTVSGTWALIHSTPALKMSTGDLNGQGKDDLLGVWNGLGTWVFYSENSSWLKIHDTAPVSLAAGKSLNENADPIFPTDPADSSGQAKVQSFRKWNLVGNDLTPGQTNLALVIIDPVTNTQYLDIWIDTVYFGRYTPSAGLTTINPSIESLQTGTHTALVSANNATQAFVKLTFYKSHPYYVLMTNDWDYSDNPDSAITLINNLRTAHPKMKMTSFIGPYTFTDTAVSSSRRTYLVNWVLGMKTTYGDEVGLHIHPYVNFVQTTTVTAKTTPAWNTSNYDSTGYLVYLYSYTQTEMGTLFTKAKSLFQTNGLGTPTSFRAGGWTNQIHTLKALETAGFVADSSPCNWARIEECIGTTSQPLYYWCQTNWSLMNDTSQPFYASQTNIQVAGTPRVNVLQLPNNGCLVDYVTSTEMISIFTSNWSSLPLSTPKAYVFGFHPPNFSTTLYNRLHPTCTHIEQYLAVDDKGPVIYETVSNMSKVWK